MHALKHCIVVTSFDINQPGYLDFSYRVQALYERYRLTVISQHSILEPSLLFSNSKYLVMGEARGKLGWLNYLWKVARYIRKTRPALVVLLHSGLAPVTLLIGNVTSCLYWNEHPTNLTRLPENFAPVRYIAAIALQKLVFLGARRASLIMPIGEEHRDDLLLNGCRPTNIAMLYMGVADNFYLPKPLTMYINPRINTQISNQTIKLIYTGTVSAERGRDVMLNAMQIVARHQASVNLTIIGASERELIYCTAMIQQLGIADYVKVIGRLLGEQIPSYLAEVDIGLCLWEDKIWWRFNPPTKLFEYLVAGLPVMASNIRTHTRYVQHQQNGWIFDYDAQSLAYAIIEMANNPQQIPLLKKNAAEAGQQYLWSKLAPKFIEAVTKVAPV